MNRRLMIVLVAVIALLTVAPHLPAWVPLAWAAVRSADYAALAATALQQRWLIPAGVAASGVLLLGLLVQLIRRRRRESALPSVVPARAPRMAACEVLPKPIETAAAPVTVPAALVEPSKWARAVPARTSARRESVRRLSQQGRSVVEISRATRIGQDGVRLLVSLPRIAADAR
ncbi:MAG TPA: hypothetical protein VHW65_13530 [Gemmatimonadales bacterium]|jgi:hypothetical protein|nr:hypothetical protein [Gemmatimonadales bacterium]